MGLGLVIFAAGTLIGWFLPKHQSALEARTRIGTVQVATFERVVDAIGTVTVPASPTLLAPSAGVVTFRVKAGDPVVRGQTLAKVSSPAQESVLQQERATLEGLEAVLDRESMEARRQAVDEQTTVALAAAQERVTTRELERDQHGLDMGIISRDQFDKAQDASDGAHLNYGRAISNARLLKQSNDFDLTDKRATIQRQKLLIEDQTRRIDALSIRAPVRGVVGSLLVSQYASVAESTPLLTVVDLSVIEVIFTVSESEAPGLVVGTAAVVKSGSTSYPATVTSIYPEIKKGKLEGRLRFDENMPLDLRESQSVDVDIILSRKQDALIIPRSALGNGTSYVYRVENDVALRQPVAVEEGGGDTVEVLRGLVAGDRIVVSGLERCEGAQKCPLSAHPSP